MDKLADNPLDTDAGGQINQQAKSVLGSANEGGWAISEEGAKVYIQVCDKFWTSTTK